MSRDEVMIAGESNTMARPWPLGCDFSKEEAQFVVDTSEESFSASTCDNAHEFTSSSLPSVDRMPSLPRRVRSRTGLFERFTKNIHHHCRGNKPSLTKRDSSPKLPIKRGSRSNMQRINSLLHSRRTAHVGDTSSPTSSNNTQGNFVWDSASARSTSVSKRPFTISKDGAPRLVRSKPSIGGALANFKRLQIHNS